MQNPTHTERRVRSDGVVQRYHVGNGKTYAEASISLNRDDSGLFAPGHASRSDNRAPSTGSGTAPAMPTVKEQRALRRTARQREKSRAWAEKAVSKDHPKENGYARAATVNSYANQHFRNHTEFNAIQRASHRAVNTAVGTAVGAAAFAALEAGLADQGATATDPVGTATYAGGAALVVGSFATVLTMTVNSFRDDNSNRSIRYKS